MAEPNRLFFALWPDEPVRGASAEAARDLKVRVQPGGSLSTPERYHLTLLFLGDFVTVAQEALALEAAAQVRAAPFSLTLDHAGSFRNKGGIPWWLGPRETPAGLDALYHALREHMAKDGVAVDRMRFTPHLTIIRDAQRALPDTRIKPIDWEVREFVLARSLLAQRPAEYEVVGRWPLIAGAPPPSVAQMPLF